jgi:hypothetical protein
MAWPLSQDYNEAVQNPESSFADPELRGGQVATNALGLPMPCSGNFADVYRFNCPTSKRSWAVKCFTRQIPGLQERYQQISRHLAMGKPPFMVDFTFLDRGIQIRGTWYPILKMEWVEGLTLNQFVKSNLDKPQVLDVLCQLWVKLAMRLREANIAHCDLQHGNVLLVPGGKAGTLQVRLVDYDGMCVPALTLLKSIEAGHPAYQHPQRLREGIYSLEVDRFSHLVIYTALRSLVLGGQAPWHKYDDGDNLLFKPSDFASPTKSPLFYELLKSTHPEQRNLAEALLQTLAKPLDQAPLLQSLVPTTPTRVVPAGGATAPSSRVMPRPKPVTVFAEATEGGAAATLPNTGRYRKPQKSAAGALVAAGVAALVLAAGAVCFVLYGGSRPAPEAVVAERNKPAKLTRKATAPPETTPQPATQPQLPPREKSVLPEVPPEVPAEPYVEPLPPAVAPQPAPQPTPQRKPPPRPPVRIIRNPPRPRKKLPAPRPPVQPAPQAEVKPEIKPDPQPAPRPENPSPATPAGDKPGDGKDRLPVPGDDALGAALDKVKEAYQTVYEKRKPLEMHAAATRLFQEGLDTKENPVLQFVLLREARDLSADAGDAILALRALEELARRFLLNHLQEKPAVLERVARGAWTAATHRLTAETALAVAAEAKGVDDFTLADRVLRIANGAAQQAKSKGLETIVQQRLAQNASLRKEYDGLQDAVQTLVAKAADPGANLAIGQFCCFLKEDWSKGLPLLVLGSDPALASLAKKDVERPTAAAGQVEVADAWWTFAEQGEGVAQVPARRRAYLWYMLALPGLSGVEETRVENRTRALAKMVPGLQSPWDDFDVSDAVAGDGFLRLQPGRGIVTRRAYPGAVTITAIARTQRYNIRLHAAGGGELIFNWEVKQGDFRVHRPDKAAGLGSLALAKVMPLAPSVWHQIRWRITERGMDVTVDGHMVFAEPRNYDLASRQPVRIFAFDSVVDVKSLVVTPSR